MENTVGDKRVDGSAETASPSPSGSVENWCARDTIAVAAMQGLIAGLTYVVHPLYGRSRQFAPDHADAARQAYRFADAMLLARNQD